MAEALTKAQKAQIKSLMKDTRWDAVVRYLGIRLETLRAERATGTNEFETLRSLFTRDGKVDGLTEFFDDLERQAFDE